MAVTALQQQAERCEAVWHPTPEIVEITQWLRFRLSDLRTALAGGQGEERCKQCGGVLENDSITARAGFGRRTPAPQTEELVCPVCCAGPTPAPEPSDTEMVDWLLDIDNESVRVQHFKLDEYHNATIWHPLTTREAISAAMADEGEKS
jgi:hypothetical protein